MSEERFEAMRKAMVVSQLRPSDVNDPRIVAAMGAVPRERFVPEGNRLVAYADRGADLGAGRRLSPPLTTGLMLTAARLTADDRVLVVGAGTGYLAALIAPLVASVVALEADGELAGQAAANLGDQANVRVEKGALRDGFAAAAPYSLILIDGAVDEVPQALIDQLDESGRIIAPILQNGISRLSRGVKAGDIVSMRAFADGASQPIAEFARPKAFTF